MMPKIKKAENANKSAQFARAHFAHGAREVFAQSVPVAGAAQVRQPARQRTEAVHPDQRQATKEAKHKHKHGGGGEKRYNYEPDAELNDNLQGVAAQLPKILLKRRCSHNPRDRLRHAGTGICF